MTQDPAAIREQVRERYAAAASNLLGSTAGGGCCGPAVSETGGGCGPRLYSVAERGELPGAAVEASLGCGNPLLVAELRPGETVLDLGSGGGIDVLLSARRVGPTGKAYGLDMTDEMLELARRNAAEAGATNVEFLRGQIENIPLPANSVDVVISNCVVNLSTDKPAVFASMHQVLRPGGRIGVADLAADNRLTRQEIGERGDWAGCAAGALTFADYEQGLRDAGFVDVEITPLKREPSGIHPAIIRARKPAAV